MPPRGQPRRVTKPAAASHPEETSAQQGFKMPALLHARQSERRRLKRCARQVQRRRAVGWPAPQYVSACRSVSLFLVHVVKDSPHPHSPFALGLLKTNSDLQRRDEGRRVSGEWRRAERRSPAGCAPQPVTHKVHARAHHMHQRLVVHQHFHAQRPLHQLVKLARRVCARWRQRAPHHAARCTMLEGPHPHTSSCMTGRCSRAT